MEDGLHQNILFLAFCLINAARINKKMENIKEMTFF